MIAGSIAHSHGGIEVAVQGDFAGRVEDGLRAVVQRRIGIVGEIVRVHNRDAAKGIDDLLHALEAY